MISQTAQAAAKYMAEHNWMRDGVAWEQVAAVIDREILAHPSKALRALALEAIEGRCPNCGERRRIEIET